MAKMSVKLQPQSQIPNEAPVFPMNLILICVKLHQGQVKKILPTK